MNQANLEKSDCWGLQNERYIPEVVRAGLHLLPGFIEKVDANAEEFFKWMIIGEKHRMELIAVTARGLSNLM